MLEKTRGTITNGRYRDTGGDLKETGTVTPSPAHGFTSVFNGVRVVHILVCFLCCVSFFV